MTYTNPPVKRSKLPIVLVVAAVLLVLGCLVGSVALLGGQAPIGSPVVEVTTPPKTVLPSTTSPPTDPTVDPAAAPKRTNKPASIGEGMWEVGNDVAPGKYRTPGAVKGLIEFCMWTVKASDDPDSNVVDLGSSGVSEPGRVTLKKGQSFDTSGCEAWVKQ